MRARLVIGVIVAGLLTTATHAQSNKDEAERLFERGRTLMKEGQYAQACTLLEESFSLARGVGVQYNLARCLAELGRLASAHRHFVEVAELSRRAGQPERAHVAEERARALEPRLAWLRIEVRSPTEGLSIHYGDKRLPRQQWGREIAVDPGRYRVTAAGPARRAWETTVNVTAEGQHAVVEIPPPEPLAPPPKRPPPPETPPPSNDPLPLYVSGGIIGGLGVIALGVSGGLAAMAVTKNDAADAYCDDSGCDPQGLALVDEAQTYGNGATITLVSGLVLAGGGLALLITGIVTDSETAALFRGVRF